MTQAPTQMTQINCKPADSDQWSIDVIKATEEDATDCNAVILAASGIGAPVSSYHIINPDGLSIRWERGDVLEF